MPRIRKQAVVVIHGIGEQRPMQTLRAFVSGVLPGVAIISRPDTFSGSYELRRLTAEHGTRHRTDFFELYWADKVHGTTVAHLVQWARALLLRWPWRVPPHLRGLWGMTWAFLLFAGLGAGLFFARGALPFDQLRYWSLLIPVLLGIPQGILIYYLGDAARYLSPIPRNVGVRKAIRDTGIDLLRRLHAAEAYDRIIVVGHSLGSVIAYDILRCYWAEIHAVFTNPARQRQSRLQAFEDLLVRNETGAPDSAQYRAHQRAVWTELRRHGHAWKVSDLVTLGSPLAHAAILLADDQRDLWQRFRDRELPTNPPQLDYDATLSFAVEPAVTNARGELVTPRAPHHAASFCCTRWTNLFFPARLGLFGDVVGGPLQPVFGDGIRDLPLTEGTLWRHTLLSHTRYWRSRGAAVLPGTPTVRLADALDLLWVQDRDTREPSTASRH
jgi:hypothetical protein